MIDLENRIITLGKRNYPIRRFEIWWHCPFGLFTELHEALDKVNELKAMDGYSHLEPNLAIRGIPVAVGDNGIYEALGG